MPMGTGATSGPYSSFLFHCYSRAEKATTAKSAMRASSEYGRRICLAGKLAQRLKRRRVGHPRETRSRSVDDKMAPHGKSDETGDREENHPALCRCRGRAGCVSEEARGRQECHQE